VQDDTGKITHFVAVKEDITERKQTDAAMHDLSRRLIRAHEAERARLGRELHDDVTQRLAVLAIDVGRVERGADKVLEAETMRGIREGLVRLSEDIHALSYRLHPSVLEDLGLAEALRAECERFSRQESIPIDLKLLELPNAISPETALCLFRVAQEALRNVARHAKTSRVEITVRTLNGDLQLVVQDYGIGFDPASQRAHPSLGLASMRERVFLVNGELDIESTPGQGTTILVTVPISAHKNSKRNL
jgi:signal transduction histidine kinase